MHLVTNAHKRCYNATFSLLVVLSKSAAFIPFWSFCVQNAFLSIYSETFFYESEGFADILFMKK